MHPFKRGNWSRVIGIFVVMMMLTTLGCSVVLANDYYSSNYAKSILDKYNAKGLAAVMETAVPDKVTVFEIKGYKGGSNLFHQGYRGKSHRALLIIAEDNVLVRSYQCEIAENGILLHNFNEGYEVNKGDILLLNYMEGGTSPLGMVCIYKKDYTALAKWYSPVSDGKGYELGDPEPSNFTPLYYEK